MSARPLAFGFVLLCTSALLAQDAPPQAPEAPAARAEIPGWTAPLSPKGERDRESHDIALDLRARVLALDLPEGAAVKVVEPPPGPPVMATLLAEVYGPDAETRRAVALKLREIFATIPYIVDVDDSFGVPAERQRLVLNDANLDLHKVEQGDVFQQVRLIFLDR